MTTNREPRRLRTTPVLLTIHAVLLVCALAISAAALWRATDDDRRATDGRPECISTEVLVPLLLADEETRVWACLPRDYRPPR